VRLVLEGGHRCFDGAGGGQQALWVADPQHPQDFLTGYYCPAYAGACAADGDPLQRREALGSKEIQAAQIKDQPAATHQMPQRVPGQSVRVGCQGCRRPAPRWEPGGDLDPQIAGGTEDFFVNVQRCYERFDRHAPTGTTANQVRRNINRRRRIRPISALRSGRVPPLRAGAEGFEHPHCVVPVLGVAGLRERGFAPGCADVGRAARTFELIDEYLRFVAARSRPNTMLATAYDLKVFFSVNLWLYPVVAGQLAPTRRLLAPLKARAVAMLPFAEALVATPSVDSCDC
jgi:hypothetical protein